MALTTLRPKIKISNMAEDLHVIQPHLQQLSQLIPRVQPHWTSVVCLNILCSSLSWGLCICYSLWPRHSSCLLLPLQNLVQTVISRKAFLVPLYVPLYHPVHLLCIMCHHFNYIIICVVSYLMPAFFIPLQVPWQQGQMHFFRTDFQDTTWYELWWGRGASRCIYSTD